MSTLNLEYVDVFDENKKKELVFSAHLIKEEFNEASLFANMVDGESMQPVIKNRSVVVADLSKKDLIEDGIYLVFHNEKMWIKKYNKNEKTFFSINPNYSHLVYKQDEVHVVAKVLLTFTSL